ncbi:Conserved_hypothetical protein [Hexamita inflata]|uniref:Uncharacterized protein n=1 Tax=Hexamita inflata TaxID=28002 RepID=A0AA86QXX1_9EUKA|nr:Conserved hypothetical protein [Hexamita inflata]
MPNQEIRSQEDLFNHLGSSQKLEIGNLQQMENLLEMNVQPDVWEDASNRNLLSFNQEFAQGTTKLVFFSRWIKHIYLISFFTNLIDLDLSNNNISDISSIAKLKNLRTLDLNSNCIEDISALQSIHDLTHLYLSCNKFTSYNLGYNILLNQRDYICLEQKPQIYVLFRINYSVQKYYYCHRTKLPKYRIFRTFQICKDQNQIIINSFKIFNLLNSALNLLNQVFMKQVLLIYGLFNF